MTTYHLTSEKRESLLREHIEEFGDSEPYDHAVLHALRTCPSTFKVERDIYSLDEGDIVNGTWTPGEIVILCDEYRNGHTTLPEVTQ